MKKTSVFFAVFLSACATKQYPQAYTLTDNEIAVYNCEDIRKEIVKNKAILMQIEETGHFNELTILGVVGDLGIGNGIAKDKARSHAKQRIDQLARVEKIKCHSGESFLRKKSR